MTTLRFNVFAIVMVLLSFNSHAHQKVCERHELLVALIPNDPTLYNVVGDLCWRGTKQKNAVELLVHGATYTRSYWDFQYDGGEYSYVDYATKKGRVTFSYDRLGSGDSDLPLGVLVNVDNSAYVNSQIVSALRSGAIGHAYNKVTLIGHSFGSLIAVAAASTYQDVDALVLTGFAHQATEQANTATGGAVYPAMFDPKFAVTMTDDTYFTTIPGTRASLFFNVNHVKNEVLVQDELSKDLFALGLVMDIGRHFSTESLAITAPVFMIMGDEDFIYCGENIDCSNKNSLQTYEENFFNSPLEAVIIKDAGHSLGLHKNAKKVYQKISKWIKHNT